MVFSSLTGIFKPNILQELEAKRRQLVSEGREIINLSVGTPDLPPDSTVIAAVREAALNPENYKYSLHDIPQLQDAVMNWYDRRYGVSLDRDEILAVYGSQEGIAHIAFVLCDPGDTVIVGTPGYPIFSFGPMLAGAKLHRVPLLPDKDFLFDFDDIDPSVAKAAKAIIVSYPNNPLSATADFDFYSRLVAFAKKNDIAVIHDNAYSEFIHDGSRGGSFLKVPGAKDIGIEFNSLSKSHNLSGLRVSFALGNKELLKVFKSLRSQIDYGISLIDQYAAIAALNSGENIIERNRIAYRERRDALCDGLNKIGWRVPSSKSTMFAWMPIPDQYHRQTDGKTISESFALELLDRAGVICVPGSEFGEGGENFVRFALVQPVDVIKRAVEMIDDSGILI